MIYPTNTMSETDIVETTTISTESVFQKFKENKVLIGMIIILIIIMVVCIMFKTPAENYRNPQLRDDIQSDWSVEAAVKNIENYQEKVLQRIKMDEADMDDFF